MFQTQKQGLEMGFLRAWDWAAQAFKGNPEAILSQKPGDGSDAISRILCVLGLCHYYPWSQVLRVYEGRGVLQSCMCLPADYRRSNETLLPTPIEEDALHL